MEKARAEFSTTQLEQKSQTCSPCIAKATSAAEKFECVACGAEKPRKEFAEKQFHRKPKTCSVCIAKTLSAAEKLQCTACGATKSKEDFSKNQLKTSVRKCKVCVETSVLAQRRQAQNVKDERQCGKCDKRKPIQEFSICLEKTRSYMNSKRRRCNSCLDQHEASQKASLTESMSHVQKSKPADSNATTRRPSLAPESDAKARRRDKALPMDP